MDRDGALERRCKIRGEPSAVMGDLVYCFVFWLTMGRGVRGKLGAITKALLGGTARYIVAGGHRRRPAMACARACVSGGSLEKMALCDGSAGGGIAHA